MKIKFVFFLILLCPLSILSWGQTILNPGDLVIMGVNANLGGNPDEISFACFKDITTGTEIQITDQGYERCYAGLWGSGEGGARLTRTGGTILAGTVITVRTGQAAAPWISFTYPDTLWSVANLGSGAPANNFNLNSGGDQVYFAQGGTWGTDTLCSNHYPGTGGRMLFAFSTSGSWLSFGNSTQKSGLYPGMSCYNMAPTTASDFVKYTGLLTAATQKDWITRISNVTNWTRYTTSTLYLAASPNLHATTISIIPGTDADWTSPSPDTICQYSAPINLDALISGLGITGGTWSGTGVTGNIFNPSGLSGTYNITYTIDCPCCISQTHSITVNSPVATASCNTPCAGQTLNLSSGGGLDFSWSGPGSYSSSNQNPSISGATLSMGGPYTVTVTDAAGCSSTAQTTAIVNSNPIATASSNSPCEGQTLNLSSGTGTGFIWSGPNSYSSSTQNPVITGATLSMGGPYTVTVTDANGCSSTAQTIVTVKSNPIATASSNTPCEGQALNLSSGTGTGFSWSGPNNYSSSDQNPVISGATLTMAGTYTVTVTNGVGCSSTAQTIVTVKSNPIATASSNTPCEGQALNLFSGTGTGFIWSGPNSYSSSTQNPTIPVATLSLAGTYTVTVTNSGGCSSTAQTVVSINTNPTATASSNSAICAGHTLNLTSGGGDSYSWSGPNNYSSITQNPLITNVSTSASGTYTVTVTNAQGCSDIKSISVTINALPVVSLSGVGNTCCINANIITLTGTPPGGIFSGQGVVGNVFNPSLAGVGGPYQLIYSYTDANTCSGSDTTLVTVNALPIVTLQSDPYSEIYTGEVVTLTATPANYSNYNFYIGSNSIQSGISNTYQSASFINGDNVIVVATESGCNSSDTLILDVKTFPNAFTPNGNGYNDVFLKGLDLQIINRWGQQLYSGKDGWDGTYKAQVVSPGTYYYIVTLTDIDKTKKTLTGTVNVVVAH